MNKGEFLNYLPQKTFGIFSTLRSDGTPEARGWEFQFEESDKYYFATANDKNVWRQLTEHPKAAFTYMEPTGKYTVRLSGNVKVVADGEEKKVLFAKIDPLVQGMYKSWDNPGLEIIYLDKPECKLALGFAPAQKTE